MLNTTKIHPISINYRDNPQSPALTIYRPYYKHSASVSLIKARILAHVSRLIFNFYPRNTQISFKRCFNAFARRGATFGSAHTINRGPSVNQSTRARALSYRTPISGCFCCCLGFQSLSFGVFPTIQIEPGSPSTYTQHCRAQNIYSNHSPKIYVINGCLF